jgi:DNA-binding MarR family transcriptional regulator
VPAATSTAEQLVDALAAVRRALRRLEGRPDELARLSNAQLELVRLLRRRPGLSVTDAAEELRLAPNTVSTLVRQLTGARIVVRTVDEADRRVGRLDLRPDVRNRLSAWRDLRLDAAEAALAALPAEDRERIEAALPALARLAAEVGAR